MTNAKKTKKAKASGVRHTRAIALDRSKRPNTAPTAEQVEQILKEVVKPDTFSLVRRYQELGLRARTLTLPVMLAFVLSLIWRQIGSVSEAVRVLNREGMLWTAPVKITQQAVNDRLHELPAELFELVFNETMPVMHQRWQTRQRPMPREIKTALGQFKRVVAVDGSTLDALIKKTGLLRDTEGNVLAGKMMAVLDVASQLPVRIWYGEESAAHDQRWWEALSGVLEKDSLVLFDLGFVNYQRYQQLTRADKYFVTRIKSNTNYRIIKLLDQGTGVRDFLVEVGPALDGSLQQLRLVEVAYEGKWYSYLSNVLEPNRLSGVDIAWLYRQRWRIEDAFKLVKRLLGLAYFHGGSINAVCVQLWASWLLYCVLIDLSDGVAEELKQPFAKISVEMVYRGLYHYAQALMRGETRTVFEYLAWDAKLLGIIKRPKTKQLRV